MVGRIAANDHNWSITPNTVRFAYRFWSRIIVWFYQCILLGPNEKAVRFALDPPRIEVKFVAIITYATPHKVISTCRVSEELLTKRQVVVSKFRVTGIILCARAFSDRLASNRRFGSYPVLCTYPKRIKEQD